MRVGARQAIARYLNNSWWLAGIGFLAALAVSVVAELCHWRVFAVPQFILMVCTVLFLPGILGAAGRNLVKKRWSAALINLLVLPVYVGVSFVALRFLLSSSMLGPNEDHFADKLVIPKDIPVAETEKELARKPGEAIDAFQSKLLETLKDAGSDDPSVTADVTWLVNLQRDRPDILHRWLASSPGWQLVRRRPTDNMTL